MDEVLVQAKDVEELGHVLQATLTFLQASDLAKAQLNLENARPSPLTSEVERMRDKFKSYFAEFLLLQHEANREIDEEAAEDLDEAEEDAEALTEVSDAPLPDAPLGTPKVRRQSGRRLSAKELGGDGGSG